MKQTKPEPAKPTTPTKTKPTPPVGKGKSTPAPSTARRSAEAPIFTWPMLVPVGLAVLVLGVILTVGIILRPTDNGDKVGQNNAMGTALAATGITPGPTPVPGSELQLDVVILGLRDYLPIKPGEQINLTLINARLKSVYVSNCDGVVLERFTGSDPKNKDQIADDKNWKPIAPGGFKFCGPAAGREAIQIEPGVKADATFKFDKSQTRPFTGEDWNIPGTYRLLVNYFLDCPGYSLKAADCINPRSYSSDTFQIVAPPPGYTPVPFTPTPKP